MNIYDTVQLHCSRCGKTIGEVAYDAEIIFPKCSHCANPLPSTGDTSSYPKPFDKEKLLAAC